jgi:hypothetical protein
VLGIAGMGSSAALTKYEWKFTTIPGGTGLVDLPRTGQTRSYAAGDDADYKVGIAWPAPRFTDNHDGTITDNLTGLMWLKDAHCLGFRSGQGGIYYFVDSLNTDPSELNCADYTARYSDWRVPNVNEMESLINAGQAHSASWLISQGFVDVQALYYWTSTTYAYNTLYARCIHMWSGYVDRDEKRIIHSVLPVRGETTLPARIWRTGQTTSYRPGDDGELQMGAEWATPRFFLHNNNAAVTDMSTSLIWLRGAGTPTVGECTGGYMNWQEALDYVACLNANSYLGCSDWRLPNRKELYSLIDHSKYNPALPSNTPFGDVQLSKYWTSTTYAFDTSRAWMVNIQYGDMSPWDKTANAYVWPVRGGL